MLPARSPRRSRSTRVCRLDLHHHGMGRRSRKKKEKQPVVSVPDELLVEILARVPYRSLCRFKCVSRSWHALCSDPGLRKRTPQTLSRFFCYARDDHALRFRNLSGRGRPLVYPSLSLLRDYRGVLLVDGSSSLLLCRCLKSSPFDADYVVCNPATEKWTVLPGTQELHRMNIIRLGFDPAVPSRFVVFVIVQDWGNDRITGLEIYSSQTGRWTSMQSGWGLKTSAQYEDSKSFFFDGSLHLTATCDYSVFTVDTEGKTWRKIRMPHIMAHDNDYGFIGQSQGRLYAMHIDNYNGCLLSVWVLEDYGTGHWTLKHTASVLELLERHHRKNDEFYTLIAIHPECNLIFFTDAVEETLMSYDMDKQKVHVFYTIEEYFHQPCLPFIPCFAEWLTDGHYK